MLINQMSVKRVKNWLSNFDILISDNMNWGKLAIKFLKMDLLQIFPRQRVNLIANFPKSHHMLPLGLRPLCFKPDETYTAGHLLNTT